MSETASFHVTFLIQYHDKKPDIPSGYQEVEQVTFDLSGYSSANELESAFSVKTCGRPLTYQITHITSIPQELNFHLSLDKVYKFFSVNKETHIEFKEFLGKVCTYVNGYGTHIHDMLILGIDGLDVYLYKDGLLRKLNWNQCALPHHQWHKDLKNDLDNGFEITDPDDNFQRAKKISDSTFHYKAFTGENLISEIIDIDELDLDEAVKGYYRDYTEVKESYELYAPQIAAECHFESNFYPVNALAPNPE